MADKLSWETRDQLRWFFGVLGFALSVRGLHLWLLSDSPLFDLRIGDAESYHVWAQQIAAGDWMGQEVFYQAPLYPYFLGLIYAIFGDSALAVRIVQAVLGAAACGLLTLAGWRLFSKPVGITAGFILSLSATAIYFDSQLGKSVLDMFLFCLALWLISRLEGLPRFKDCVMLGVTLGLFVLTRENAILLVLALLFWIVLHFAGDGRKRFAWAACLVAGLAMALLPVAIRNWHVGGEFHLTTSQLGPNLFIGNNPDANGIYQPLVRKRSHWRYERRDATQLAENALGRKLSPGEVSRYFVGEVGSYIRHQPGHFLALLGKKFALVWNAVEVADTEDIYTYAEWSWLLRASLAVTHFGILVPLAAAGVLATLPDRRRLWVLYLLLVTYASSVVVFYVFARYRFPLVPLLVLFAAAGVVRLAVLIRQRAGQKVAVCIVPALAIALFCNWPLISKDAMRAGAQFNLGIVHETRGQLDDAAGAFRRAGALNPHPDVFYGLGRVLLKQGELTEAGLELQRAIQLDAQHAAAHCHLGLVLQQQGKLEAAIEKYHHALRLQPDLAEAHNALAAVQITLGDYAAALKRLHQALAAQPEFAEAHGNLGLTLLRQNKLDEAESTLRKAIQLDPELAAAHNNLGLVYDRQGKSKAAIAEYEVALEISPAYAEAHNNLGMALGSQGRLEDASDHFGEAIRFDRGYALAYLNQGLVLLQKGNYASAERYFLEALELDPQLEAARRNLDLVRESRSRAP